MVFKNMHEMGDINALYFHDVPVIGSFYQHGVAHYNTSFFKVMAWIQKYEMIYAFLTEYGDDDNLSVVVAAYTKTESNPFMSFEEFCLLPGLESRLYVFRFSIQECTRWFLQSYIIFILCTTSWYNGNKLITTGNQFLWSISSENYWSARSNGERDLYFRSCWTYRKTQNSKLCCWFKFKYTYKVSTECQWVKCHVLSQLTVQFFTITKSFTIPKYHILLDIDLTIIFTLFTNIYF